MTTPTPKPDTIARTYPAPGRFRLPDPPEDPEDKMTTFDHLTITGAAHYLALHLMAQYPDLRDRILVAGERYTVVQPTRYLAGSRYPDLLVAFDVDPEAYAASNGYIILEQGKPPDFVLEIASRSSGRADTGPKRRDYAAIGILEYWRFDRTGEHHGARLSGERLADGEYVAIDIEELPDGSLQGYSAMLNLYLRWEDGELVFYDPATGRRIVTLEDERARADSERAARATAEARADTAETRADTAEARADTAEARVRELEALLCQQNP